MTTNTPIQSSAVDQVQKLRVDCAILAHAYAQSVKSFVRWNECISAFSAIVCIGYFVLFGIWYNDAKTARSLSTIQAILNGILFCVTIYSLFRRWQSRQEFHQQQAIKYSELLSRIDIELKSGVIPTAAKAKAFQREYEQIRDQTQTGDKGEISQRFHQQGHQHASNTYPQLEVKCYKCNRTWRPEFDRRLASLWKPKSWLPWCSEYCNNCGVKYDE
jgi:hypothetical protein